VLESQQSAQVKTVTIVSVDSLWYCFT